MLPVGMILSGIGILLPSGFLLFCDYGLASMTDDTDPNYWSEVLSRMFAAKFGLWMAISSCVGLVLGVALVSIGIRKGWANRV